MVRTRCIRERLAFFSLFIAIVAAGLTAASGTSAQPSNTPYPDRAVRIINPFAAGGSLDVLGRMLAQKLSEKWGQPVVVENRPGGSTVIGLTAIAHAEPDGYTLGLATNTFAMNASRFRKLPYDSRKDLAPVSLLVTTPFMLVTRADFPATTLAEFVVEAKKRPGLSYGSIGVATSPHIGGEILKKATGLKMEHVPYKGTPLALQDLLGGSIAIMFANIPDVVPHVQAGRLRALATTDVERTPAFPDVPTTRELGYPSIDLNSWYAMVAPGNTPRSIIDKVSADVKEVMGTSEFRQRLRELEMKPVASSPEALGELLASEFNRFEKLIDEIGLERVE